MQLKELNKRLEEETERLDFIKDKSKYGTLKLSSIEIILKNQIIEDLRNKMSLIYFYKKNKKINS